MAHRICRTAQTGELPYLQGLWEHVFAPDVDLGNKLETMFADETDEFGLEHAFFSRIDTDTETQHFEIAHGPHEALRAGNTVPLSRTYCRKTIADPTGTMAVSDAAAEGWNGDPAYETFGLGSYVGTTLTVDDELYGTLCFANTAPRAESITGEEMRLVEMFGDWASFELNQWTGPPTHDALTGSFDLVELSSTRIDAMMNALMQPERRLVLLTLLTDTEQKGIDFVERRMDVKNPRTDLYHNHLPKLEAAGYVEWDHTTGSLSRGPKYVEIEPLLRLLREHAKDVPE